MRCPFAAAFASPVPAALAVCLLAVLPATVAAEPTVAVSRRARTTEPEPPTPIVTLRPAPAGSAILDVIGPGDWCSGMWTVAETERELIFGLTRDRSIAMGGTCALRLTVSGLRPGRWRFHIGAARVTGSVR